MMHDSAFFYDERKVFQLDVEDLELFLYIGLKHEERCTKQKICVSVSVHSSFMPKAAELDSIEDTINYHTLCIEIKKLEKNQYKLIEKLSFDVINIVCNFLSSSRFLQQKKDESVKVRVVVKKYPKIKGLSNGNVRCVLHRHLS